jgi:hypothetical protein
MHRLPTSTPAGAFKRWLANRPQVCGHNKKIPDARQALIGFRPSNRGCSTPVGDRCVGGSRVAVAVAVEPRGRDEHARTSPRSSPREVGRRRRGRCGDWVVGRRFGDHRRVGQGCALIRRGRAAAVRLACRNALAGRRPARDRYHAQPAGTGAGRQLVSAAPLGEDRLGSGAAHSRALRGACDSHQVLPDDQLVRGHRVQRRGVAAHRRPRRRSGDPRRDDPGGAAGRGDADEPRTPPRRRPRTCSRVRARPRLRSSIPRGCR